MRALGSFKLGSLFLLILLFVMLPVEAELYPDPDNENAYLGNYIDDLNLNAVPADKTMHNMQIQLALILGFIVFSTLCMYHLFLWARRRACIRRGGNCDHRPNDCCYNSSCRCNLWGSNCRCQRMGLFQKWG